MAGDYSPDKIRAGKRDYWTTIQPAKGVKRDEINIGKGRPSTDKLLFKNISLVGDFDTGKYNVILTGENGKNIIWLDNCKVYNKHGRWKGYVACFANKYMGYVTGGICTEMQRAPGAVLMRDYRIEKIAEDVFTDSKTAINCSVDGVDAGETGGHSDFHQSYSPTGFTSGVILYNCRGVNCVSQGFFGSNLKDSAFVNCLFVKTPNNALASQYSGKLDHVLFFHLTVPNQRWVWRDGLKTRNCFIMNSIIKKMSAYSEKRADFSGVTISFNHFIDKNSCDGGLNETTGVAEFVNPQKGNYNLKTTSPAFHTGRNLQTVPSDINGKKWNSKNPNRGAFGN